MEFTIESLIEELSKFPKDMPVFVRNSEFGNKVWINGVYQCKDDENEQYAGIDIY